MKLLKLAVIALFTLGTVSNASAQDENNPYVIGFGVNVVDLSDYPGSTENWNFLSNLSRVSYEKYLEALLQSTGLKQPNNDFLSKYYDSVYGDQDMIVNVNTTSFLNLYQ